MYIPGLGNMDVTDLKNIILAAIKTVVDDGKDSDIALTPEFAKLLEIQECSKVIYLSIVTNAINFIANNEPHKYNLIAIRDFFAEHVPEAFVPLLHKWDLSISIYLNSGRTPIFELRQFVKDAIETEISHNMDPEAPIVFSDLSDDEEDVNEDDNDNGEDYNHELQVPNCD